MALECTLLWELEPAVPFTCADGTGIEKGALLILTDPMTVATATGDNDEIIGIAGAEKIANNGMVKIPVYLRGIFKGFAGAAGVTAGLSLISDVGTGAPNEMVVSDAGSESTLGMALETATDTQSFKFLLQPQHTNIA